MMIDGGVLDALEHLPGLALGRDSRSDDHLGLMHFLDIGRTTESHSGTQGTDEVLVAVGLGGGTEKYFFKRAGSADLDAGAAGQGGVGV